MMDTDIERAGKAVEEAWQRVKIEGTDEARDAFDLAYARWETLCPPALRGVGRKVSGDAQPMTSAQRSQAARTRQQQSAARWERAAPIIQSLRKAIEAGDKASALAIATSLVQETTMLLKDFNVVHAQPDSDFVVIHAWHDRQMVLGFVPTVHLEDHFRRRSLTGKQANLLVDRNLSVFARIISAKYERGEYRAYARSGSTLPRVDVTLEDIEACGEKLTSGVLDIAAASGWLGPDGRISPA